MEGQIQDQLHLEGTQNSISNSASIGYLQIPEGLWPIQESFLMGIQMVLHFSRF